MNVTELVIERDRAERPRLRVGWASAVTALSSLGVLLWALYGDVLVRMVVQWYEEPDYSHGFLVPLLSAYFVWERRRRLAGLPLRPNLWGAGVLAAGLLMLILGVGGAELYLQRTSLLVVLTGLTLLLLGGAHLRVLAFPILFLAFMVPLPAIVVNAVAFPLQLVAAKTATFCLFNLGVPVLREGNIILLPGTRLEVAEACSGIRSLQALLALGCLYAYFFESVWWKRGLLVLLAVPIAIAANAFRVAGTGLLAQTWGTEAAEGFYHGFSGWLVFVAAWFLLVACGAALSRAGRRPGRRGWDRPPTRLEP